MDHDEPLTERQRRYVQHRAAGMDSRAAARAAGYSDSFAKVAAYRLMKIPAVAGAIAKIREEGMKMSAYSVNEAMKEADESAAFAKLHKNPMALVKARELKMKLAGFLKEHIQIETVDLKGAIEAARLRIINPQSVIPHLPQHDQHDEPDDEKQEADLGSAQWRRGHA